MCYRLNAAGVFSMADLWALPPKHMRAIWRSVEGERFWAQLHGHDIPDIVTNRSTFGHSRVLEPALRKPERACEVARKLLVKAAARLRDEAFSASILGFSARWNAGASFSDVRRFNHSQDTLLFLRSLDDMWNRMLGAYPPQYIRTNTIIKISVMLAGLLPQDEVTGDLFSVPIRRISPLKDNKSLSHALDRIHARYGADAITIGVKSKKLDQFGTKIAFTRVPDIKEFET